MEIRMVHYHKLNEEKADFQAAVARHSADKTVIYKEVEEQPVRLGWFFPKQFELKKASTGKLPTYPLFVMVHGGGWSGHKIFEDQSCWQGDYLGYLARYFADRGFVCVSVDYRLIREDGQAPGYGILECYEDCCDAMDFIFSKAEECGLDKERCYLLGESAGGHLAGALATFHYDRTYSFKKAFLVNPITHFEDYWGRFVPTVSKHPHLAPLTLPERKKFLAPLSQITGNTCDVVLIHGEEDTVVSPEHAKAFYDKRKEFPGECKLHLIEKTGHAFLLAEYTKQLEACGIGIRIIEENL